MTEKRIQSLYNNLIRWEGRSMSRPYPIHKKLNSKRFRYEDIYDWISNTYNINSNTKVLDAGCGVGYGALYLSKRHQCKVDGISLSNEEIKTANKFVSQLDLNDLVNFKEQSYDNLNARSYDLIIAIESLKHSLDIEKTKASLKNALKPDGIIVIIDDFFNSDTEDSTTNKYAKDWALKVILKQEQFTPDFTKKADLTPYVQHKNNLQLNLGIALFSMLKPFSKAAPIIRGGLYLEKLFKAQKMSYYALEFKK